MTEPIKIRTLDGHQFDIFSPMHHQCSAGDVARSLSHQCRFNGHVNQFYSVAEHCCILYDHLKARHARSDLTALALLHDATEAYLSDVVTPLKRHTFVVRPGGEEITKFADLEAVMFDTIVAALAPGVKISPSTWTLFDRYDKSIVHDEWLVLRPGIQMPDRVSSCTPLGVDIHCWSADTAMYEYLKRVNEINGY